MESYFFAVISATEDVLQTMEGDALILEIILGGETIWSSDFPFVSNRKENQHSFLTY